MRLACVVPIEADSDAHLMLKMNMNAMSLDLKATSRCRSRFTSQLCISFLLNRTVVRGAYKNTVEDKVINYELDEKLI